MECGQGLVPHSEVNADVEGTKVKEILFYFLN